jgi:hypothetical protein
VLLTLVNQRTDEPASLAKSARLIGYATLLLVTLQARYSQEYAGDAFTPYQRWFQQTQRYPSAKLLWTERFDSEQPLPNAATEFITRHIVEQYFSRLYEKIADQPGKSPQVMSRDADDILSFERRYNGGKPNLPTLKYDRLGDIFFELDWITTDSLHEFESTPRAEAVLAQLVNFEGLE